jgi:hypothetical protein
VGLSPICYNESPAGFYFPLDKEEVLARGWRWKDPDPRDYAAQNVHLPDTISEATDGILQQTLACAQCGKNYRIIPQEIAFYRKMNIPLPRKCCDCRRGERFNMRNPRRLYLRTCAHCAKPTKTSYPPNRSERVFCIDCYLHEVY